MVVVVLVVVYYVKNLVSFRRNELETKKGMVVVACVFMNMFHQLCSAVL